MVRSRRKERRNAASNFFACAVGAVGSHVADGHVAPLKGTQLRTMELARGDRVLLAALLALGLFTRFVALCYPRAVVFGAYTPCHTTLPQPTAHR